LTLVDLLLQFQVHNCGNLTYLVVFFIQTCSFAFLEIISPRSPHTIQSILKLLSEVGNPNVQSKISSKKSLAMYGSLLSAVLARNDVFPRNMNIKGDIKYNENTNQLS